MANVVEGRAQQAVGEMFNRISRRYDLANRLLSFGIDQLWRHRTLHSLGNLEGKTLLDVATGTGDLLWLSGKLTEPPRYRIGLDYSPAMIRYGRTRHPDEKVNWLHGSGDALPLRDNSVDAITIAFGIRNIAEYPTALREFHRVLVSGGKVAILEFSIPANPVWRSVYGFYFHHVLPVVGGVLSGNFDAYRYLPASVDKFPYGERFCEYMRDAGFQEVRGVALTGGIATLYTGRGTGNRG